VVVAASGACQKYYATQVRLYVHALRAYNRSIGHWSRGTGETTPFHNIIIWIVLIDRGRFSEARAELGDGRGARRSPQLQVTTTLLQ